MKATELLRFSGTVRRDPAIAAWFDARTDELGEVARRWFAVLRGCGRDVREVLHDGHPTACVGDAGFSYVNCFKAHVGLGFFRGADLDDPQGLLEGTGNYMRHVKLGPGRQPDPAALRRLVEAAYADMRERVRREALGAPAKGKNA